MIPDLYRNKAPDAAAAAPPARALVPAAAPPTAASRVPPAFWQRRPARAAALALVLAATAGLVLWSLLPQAPAPLRYKIARVDRGPIAATVTATGTVNPVTSVQVGSQVSGIIQKLYADYNSVVAAGDAVAQIDPAPFRTKVAQARAALKTARGNLSKAKAALELRRVELDRATALRRRQFVPQSDLDLARTNHRDAAAQVEVAAAQVDQARAALDSAELDLDHTVIYSPVNGVVVSRNVDVGQTVAASFQTPTLFVIAEDLSRMEAHANVSESDIGGVADGKEARFTVDAYPKETFIGTITQVRNSPISIQNVVTYDVVIGVDNRDFKLKPGMTANVTIVTARKVDALRVPNVALRFRMPGAGAERKRAEVWTIGPKGDPRAVGVQPGIADSTYTEVLGGDLKEGEPVIVGVETDAGGAPQDLPPGFGGIPKMR